MANEKKKIDSKFIVQLSLIIVLGGLLLFILWKPSSSNTSFASVSASEIMPTGVPAIYGSELKISYDDVSINNPYKAEETIALLGKIDTSEILTGADLQRYINILYVEENGISCEYCCGARAVIFENGEPACGCAHSYAMRGLAKYLIKFHGSEFTDDEILSEVGKWKVLFFPGIHEAKAQVLEANGIDSTNYINLASNKYRGIEQGQGSGAMVGGC